MSRIAFVGLGIMGSPMACHLARGGHDVVGHNRSPGKTGPLVEAGGTAAGSLAEALTGADVVCLMLPDSPDVESVVTGDGGVLDTAATGTLILDFSTIRPDVTRALAATTAERGLRLLDAPVSGGQTGAQDAALSIMVGGAADDVEAARPILDLLGTTVVHVGDHGAGQTVKAANQLIVAANLQALAEAVVFLEAHDVDIAAALEVLGGGLAGSRVLAAKRRNLLEHSFEPGFRVDLHHKDLGIVTAAAREAGVVVPLGATVAQMLAAARANGDGDLDHSALLRVVERLSGRAR